MKDKKTMALTIVGLILLVGATIGITYAIFNYAKEGTTENTVTVGNLKFLYTEISGIGNGISITDALPMSDTEGKAQTGIGKVFDFKVEANTPGAAAIPYEITASKDGSSTLDENIVKVHLTEVNGSSETDTPFTFDGTKVVSYSELSDTRIKNGKGKTIYTGEVPKNTNNYLKTFKMRMWIDEKADFSTGNYNGKAFTVKVNVYANALNEQYRLPVYTDRSGANEPVLAENMIPVVYNEEKSTWVKADVERGYFDYSSQIWANAVTVADTKRAAYLKATPGTEISMNDINAMFVWIPRYEYQYSNLGNTYAGGTKGQPGEIKVRFIPKTQTMPSDVSIYKVHPAFSFGGVETAGIWVGKFETTGSLLNDCTNATCNVSTVTIKPNQAALMNHTLSTFFYMSRSMQSAGNPYGFGSVVDTHVIKNSEWGSVAYLSQSKYGKYGNISYTGTDKEIYQNKSDSYTTGSSNGTPSKEVIDAQVSYNVKGSGTGASTTGTIYGIYDMSGGAWEYTMANYDNGTGKLFSASSEFMEPYPESKYYNAYTSDVVSTACNGGICYGEALNETSGWYSDYAEFAYMTYPWLLRGANYNYNTGAGIFSYSSDSGGRSTYYGTRIVLHTDL